MSLERNKAYACNRIKIITMEDLQYIPTIKGLEDRIKELERKMVVAMDLLRQQSVINEELVLSIQKVGELSKYKLL